LGARPAGQHRSALRRGFKRPYHREPGLADFIDRYDRPETLFYLDASYNGSADDYDKGLAH